MVVFRGLAALALCAGLIGCGASKNNSNGGTGTGGLGGLQTGTGGTLGTGGSTGSNTTGMTGTGGTHAGTGGVTATGTGGVPAGTGGVTGGAGMGAAGVGAAGMGAAGMGAAGTGAAGMGAAGSSGGSGNTATGTLCTLGAVKPIVAAYVIQNSGETLVYLSTVPLTCQQMMTGGAGWLPSTMAGGQVIEIVVGALAGGTNPMVNKAITVGTLQGEVNFAPTGGSSSAEKGAASGSITFTKYMAGGPAEGMFSATYTCTGGGMGNVMGTFKAENCTGGQQY